MSSSTVSARPLGFVLLAVILLVAVVLRGWGVGYGLPDLLHPDEPNKVAFAQRMIRKSDPNPHYFEKGSLLLYSTAAVQLAYYGTGRALWGFSSFDDVARPQRLIYGTGWTAAPGTFLAGRWLTILIGVGCVLLLYRLGSELAADPRAGLAAGAMMAVAPIPVTHSRFVAENMYAVLFSLLALLAALRIFWNGRLQNYVAAGVAVGFAAGSKYPSALILVAPVLAHLLRQRTGLGVRALLVFGLASLVGFLVTTPYALLASQEFLRDLIFQQQHYTTGHVGMEGDAARYYAGLLWNVEGAGVCILAVGGWLLLLAKQWRLGAILLVFPLVYGLSVAGLPVRNDRTLLPILPFLYLGAGFAVARVAAFLPSRGRAGQVANVLVGACVALCLLGPAERSLSLARRADAVVAVAQARQWLAANLPEGSRVALESYAPFVDPDRYRVEAVPFLIQLPAAGPGQRYDYMVAAKRSYGRFVNNPQLYPDEAKAYELLFNDMEELKTFADLEGEIRVFKVLRAADRRRANSRRG